MVTCALGSVVVVGHLFSLIKPGLQGARSPFDVHMSSRQRAPDKRKTQGLMCVCVCEGKCGLGDGEWPEIPTRVAKHPSLSGRRRGALVDLRVQQPPFFPISPTAG